MKAINHYILEIENPYRDEIEIGEAKFFIDKDISRERSVNRYGKIIGVPATETDPTLKVGFEVIFDATILYKQIYKEGIQDSVFLVDAKRSWFKIESNMIILYRENNSQEWQGFKDNLMVAFIENKPTVKGNLTLQPETKFVKGKAVVKYRNQFLAEQGVDNNQEIFINPKAGVPFYFKNETLQWIRSRDTLAV